jgi:hypothetical protein
MTAAPRARTATPPMTIPAMAPPERALWELVSVVLATSLGKYSFGENEIVAF